MGKGILFITMTLTQILLLLSFATVAALRQAGRDDGLVAKRELVRALGLTDFAIWTEARYARHPSQTDFFSPFQDFPASLEHFPAGSIIAPVYSSPISH